MNGGRNSLGFLLIFFIFMPQATSLGRLDDTNISFSVCWMSKNGALERQNGNLWLNGTALRSLRNVSNVTSLTVYPVVENKLTLQYGGSTHAWAVTITPSKRFSKIQGLPTPVKYPTNATKGFLDLLSPTEVFACENGTVFLYQDADFFLAVGHTMRLPVKLENKDPSMLLLSWVESSPDLSESHTVILYRPESNSYTAVGLDSTLDSYYHLSGLESCSPYVACVEIACTHSLTCLPAVTDPDIPKDFEVTSQNSSSISLAWNCPAYCRYSLFLLTVFYLNGTDHITEEVCFWLETDSFEFTLSDLQPCTRVRFGLQTVCHYGMESRYSSMVPNDGNSVHSRITALHQTLFGPVNYTLSWEVRNTSSISKFRVYHNEALQGTTLMTNYTVGGLSSCQQYQAKVEALCGDSVLMSTRAIIAYTGPLGVSDLRYRSNNSTAAWTPSITKQSTVAFLYALSLENGTTIESSRVTAAELRLLGLDEGKTYVLDVWEECDGEWESEPSQLIFEGSNSSLEFLVRAAGLSQELEVPLEFANSGLTMVLPWSLPEELQQEGSEPRTKMEKIFTDKLQELLRDYDQPARLELATFETADDPDKTEFLFLSFDASKTDDDVSLSVDDQLDYIRSLNATNITVADGVIQWDGPDLCASSRLSLCPLNSLCINTLGSFTCVCKHGYYDVRAVIEPRVASRPICNENGLFSQCLDKLMTGGIAKPYLISYVGGKVDVQLNDGRCAINETETFYYFQTSRKSSECGTERRINKTHMEYKNTLTVALTKEQTISRRDLKVVWKCVFPRHYVRNAHVSMNMEWLSSLALVQFNSSLQLGLSMTLYKDVSYNSSYTHIISLEAEDILFFQVALQTNSSFASDVLLQVESCWATESTDPQDVVQGVLLQDGCAVDPTFHWHSVNGLAQSSRFSVQMFKMPNELPLYIHCLANVCGHDKDCTKNCTSQQRTKRSLSQTDRKRKHSAVVSVGPLVVNTRVKSGVRPTYWPQPMTMITIVAGSIGFLVLTLLSVSAIKAIMAYYEQPQQ